MGKDDFANTMVLMFTLVKFLGIISGVNKYLQVLFVVVSFVILLVVGIVTIKGAHASIVKNQKLKSLTDKHKKSQFTPLEHKLLMPFLLILTPVRFVAIKVVLFLGVV